MHLARCIETGHNVSSERDPSEVLMRLLIAATAAVERDRENALACIARTIESLSVMGRTEGLALHDLSMKQGMLSTWQVQRVFAFVRAHVGSHIRMADLAEQAGVGVGHFSRAFKVTFSETPTAFILKLRMAEARQIMLTTRRPLSQIALDCGMSDQAHFSRTFRRIVGLTPSLFRRLVKSVTSPSYVLSRAALSTTLVHARQPATPVIRMRDTAKLTEDLRQAV